MGRGHAVRGAVITVAVLLLGIAALAGPALAGRPWAGVALACSAWALPLAIAWAGRRAGAAVAAAFAVVAAILGPLGVPLATAGALAAAAVAWILAALHAASRRAARFDSGLAVTTWAALGVAAAAPHVALAARPDLPLGALLGIVALWTGAVAVTPRLLGPFDGAGRALALAPAACVAALGVVEAFVLTVQQQDVGAFRVLHVARVVAAAGLALALVGRPGGARRDGPGGAHWPWAVALVLAVGHLVTAIRASGPPPAADWRAGAAGVALLLLAVRLGVARAQAPPARPVEPRARGGDADDLRWRLVSLSEFARLVAHDLRNSLSVVFSAGSVLRSAGDDEGRDEVLAALEEEADRMSGLLDDLTRHARGEPAAEELTDLRDLVPHAVKAARESARWPPSATVEVSTPTVSLVATIDRARLTRALTGLVVATAQLGARCVSVRLAPAETAGRACLAVRGDRGTVEDHVLAQRLRPGAEASTEAVLALALARRVAAALGGACRCARGEQGALEAELELPTEPGDAESSAEAGARSG